MLQELFLPLFTVAGGASVLLLLSPKDRPVLGKTMRYLVGLCLCLCLLTPAKETVRLFPWEESALPSSSVPVESSLLRTLERSLVQQTQEALSRQFGVNASVSVRLTENTDGLVELESATVGFEAGVPSELRLEICQTLSAWLGTEVVCS